jgi:hypothetical protein
MADQDHTEAGRQDTGLDDPQPIGPIGKSTERDRASTIGKSSRLR